ncbi:MAG TPA: hypothetical protein VFV87_19330 [Pirellulaceae bacterium]|nr:hypothetical protein [Pirellulaceae bacterium]
MNIARQFSLLFVMVLVGAPLAAQPLGEPDRGQPGDEMIQGYLARESAKIAAKFSEDIQSLEAWQARRPQYVEEYYYMLGLSPRPEKTPLKATITGTFKDDDYEVDMLHYQSRPRLYVTANLYRPAESKAGENCPACSTSAVTRAVGAAATRSPFSRTASGWPATAMSA